MKSIFRIIPALLLPLLFWTGCGREALPSEGIPDHCIEITLGGLRPALTAKASSRGADAYNENLVESVDCFFYTDGGTGSNAVFSALGRGADAVAEGDSTVYKVKVFFTDSDAIRMFGDKNSGTCQLFVICNAPLSYDLAHSSVAELKELVVENDFTAQTIQRSFVMSADEIATVTLTTDGSDNRTARGRIRVSRAAAKIQFFLLIPEEFEDESNQVWEPVVDAGIGISLANAVKRGKVDGDYSVQFSDYVSYGSRAVTKLPAGDEITGYEEYNYTHVPFYSYPCAWSDLSDYATTVVFRIPWRIVGETNYQWKKYQLSPNVSTLDLKRNKYYRTFVKVSSLGGADKESAVIIPDCDYQIIPWMNETTSGGGQGVVPGELVTYKYLVMDHPEQVINNEETVYFTYVSSAPISSVRITTVQYYVNTNASPLQTQNVNTTVTADSQTVSTNAGIITVDKSNPGYVRFSHSLENMYSAITVNATITNEDGCTQNVQFVQNPSIQLVRQLGAGNVFVNGWFARLTTVPPGTGWDANSGGWNSTYYYRYTDNTTNASGTFYHNGRNTLWNTSNNRMTAGTTTIDGHTCGTYGIVLGAVNNLNNTIDRNFYTTLITVSSFNSNNDYYTANNTSIHYRIGDPRVPASDVYNGANAWTTESNFYAYVYHNNSPTEIAGVWEEPGSILIAPQNADDQSIIAPRLLVSSALNANESLTFDNIVKRGATYQEAGYPAGRWRLPTEAEIAFIVARQKEGVIPVLYATGTDYWAGSGRLVTIPTASNASITFADPASSSTVSSCRYVYDLWYWGDDPSTTNSYHPNGHLYDYDASGNATLIR